jgi:hypothetical protein
VRQKVAEALRLWSTKLWWQLRQALNRSQCPDCANSTTEASMDPSAPARPGWAEAAPGWIGSSRQALGELAARWEARHGHHKLQVGRLGAHVADAMVRYVTNEDDSTQAVRSVGD